MTFTEESLHSGKNQLLDKSTHLLGWKLIQSALSRHAASTITAGECEELVPFGDYDSALQALDETREMHMLLQFDIPFPLHAFKDIRPVLDVARSQLIIEPAQGLSVLKLLRLCRSLKRFIDKQTLCPQLKIRAQALDPIPELLKDLERCINDDGEIRDNASPELKQAVNEVARARQKLEDRMKKLIGSSNYQTALQDNYFTEREERLVVPIRAEFKSRIDGIVHDSSGSGQTLFIEPSVIVPLNNQLKISRLQVDQEKARILRVLAQQIVSYYDGLQTNLSVLLAIDLIHCRAQLARSMQAQYCPLNNDGNLDLKEARNPELVINRQHVIANDIAWDQSTRVIIISGPNTGGKTVTLKTIGLMALMARAGLFLPVLEESKMAFFGEVYADIGDDQNVQLKLSTFSGHLDKIIHIHNFAKPGALILLDELGIATDPTQGAALAEAILLEFKRKNIMTLVSTHYLSLKALAQTQEGFVNACTEFDKDSLAPTYRLIFGAPGHSAALETAERLGLEPSIIKKAKQIYGENDNRAEELLQELTRQRLHIEQEKQTVRESKEEIERMLNEQRSLTENLQEANQEFKKSKAKNLRVAVREAKLDIKKMLDDIKGSSNPRKIRITEKQIHAKTRIDEPIDQRRLVGWNLPASELKAGDSVMVESYASVGQLLEDPKNKPRVRIRLGNMTTVVETTKLRGHRQKSVHRQKNEEPIKISIENNASSKAQSSVDLRGMNSDDALNSIEAFVSQAIVNNMREATIVHGHGMGTIKKLVRDYLETTGICKSYRPGSRHEGGDGVTVLEL